MNWGHWKYKGRAPKKFIGFCYLITSPTGRKYIGRKQRYVKQSKIKESNWRTYTGSSKELNADIKAMGIKSFRFEILHFCKTLSDLAIKEVMEILNRNALYLKEYYNKWIYIKLFSNIKK